VKYEYQDKVQFPQGWLMKPTYKKLWNLLVPDELKPGTSDTGRFTIDASWDGKQWTLEVRSSFKDAELEQGCPHLRQMGAGNGWVCGDCGATRPAGSGYWMPKGHVYQNVFDAEMDGDQG